MSFALLPHLFVSAENKLYDYGNSAIYNVFVFVSSELGDVDDGTTRYGKRPVLYRSSSTVSYIGFQDIR